MITNPRAWMPDNLVSLYDQWRFEAKATVGRFFARKLYQFDSLKYLQLGCGDNRFDGFLNTDSFQNKDVDLNIDLRFPLPLESAQWSGIYAHHVVEHIGYEHAQKLFQECFRLLKSGGTFRVIVPDAEIFLRLYTHADPDQRRKIFDLYPKWVMDDLKLRCPMEMVNYVFRDSRFNQHLYAWDFETLAFRLEEVGFKVMRAKAGESVDGMLSGKDDMGWAPFSLCVDAIK
jgi:predicted SAM-dependent methyltransferase